MARGLDHIVHAVRDLDAAAGLYRSLGFTVGARNKHMRGWGTENHIVQLPETFIEVLAVTDTSDITPPAPQQFSFGAFNRDFLARQEGLSMLVLKGRGAPDADDFRDKGIGDFAVYDFERAGKRPDGTSVKVAFSLAFASDAAAETGFFTCQQHFPENFWNATFQKHANGASSVAGVVFVADDPAVHRDFMEKFSGVSATAIRGGFAIATPRGDIDVVTAAAFTARFGVKSPDVSGGGRLAAIRFTVADASLLQAAPELAGIAGVYAKNPTVIGADDTMGAVLVFEPSA
jgi:hypothetical protein